MVWLLKLQEIFYESLQLVLIGIKCSGVIRLQVRSLTLLQESQAYRPLLWGVNGFTIWSIHF